MEKPFVPRSSFGRASLGKDGAYRDLDTQGYTHRTVSHSIEFIYQRTGANTNTIESTWRHVEA